MAADNRPKRDPATESHEALVQRLERMEKTDLVALAAAMAGTYVVEGLGSLTLGDAPTLATGRKDSVGDETFAGLLKRLKRERPDDAILEKFVINGEHIQVKTPMGNIDVTVLNTGNRDAIAREVRGKVGGMVARGAGYCFHSDHSISPDVGFEDYRLAVELARECGAY